MPSADKSAYSELMAASQEAVSQQILRAYDFSRHRRCWMSAAAQARFCGPSARDIHSLS